MTYGVLDFLLLNRSTQFAAEQSVSMSKVSVN